MHETGQPVNPQLQNRVTLRPRNLGSIDSERHDESSAESVELRRAELTAPMSEGLLRDGEEVVAVDDAFARQPLRRSERHLGGKPTDRARDQRDDDLGEHRNRGVTRHYDDRVSAGGEVDVVDRAAVQSGSPRDSDATA